MLLKRYKFYCGVIPDFGKLNSFLQIKRYGRKIHKISGFLHQKET